MKLLKLDQVTGTEILAKSIMTEDYQELLSEGTVIKKEYIRKLRGLGIEDVFVKDEEIDAQALKILKEDVKKNCKEKVRNVISKHTYRDSKDMMEISETADRIITNIVEEEKVVEQIYDIKERSADIYEHSVSTCTLATLVSLKLHLSNEVVHDIGVGCLLHDIGLRYVATEFENRSLNDMTDRELLEYKKHPLYGYSSVKNEEWLSKISKEIILCHHERLDGSGYPLKATEISIETKIASVCDFFDEHICGIGCERLKVHEVVEFLKSFKGSYFDSRIVDELLEFTAVYPSGSRVITNEGETAVVIRQNKHFPERPVLQIVTDKEGNPYDSVILKDLLEHKNVFIEKVVN